MPASRFFTLYGVIARLEAEYDLRALMVAGIGANPGEKGQQFERYARQLRREIGVAPAPAATTLTPGVLPMAQFESEPGEIERERERQRQAAERLREEYRRQQRASEEKHG